MDKNLKLALISALVSACVVVAFAALVTFFGATGIPFVALLLGLAALVFLFVYDSYVRTRTRDLLILQIVFVVLELIVFCAMDFGWASTASAVKGIGNYQIVLSIVGLFWLAYVVFRIIYEACSLRYGFVEGVLGNGGGNSRDRAKQVKTQKTRKEFVNGSLEDKPNNQRKSEEIQIKETEGEE